MSESFPLRLWSISKHICMLLYTTPVSSSQSCKLVVGSIRASKTSTSKHLELVPASKKIPTQHQVVPHEHHSRHIKIIGIFKVYVYCKCFFVEASCLKSEGQPVEDTSHTPHVSRCLLLYPTKYAQFRQQVAPYLSSSLSTFAYF